MRLGNLNFYQRTSVFVKGDALYIEQNAHVAREVFEAPLREDWECLQDLYSKEVVRKGTPEPVRGRSAIVKLLQGCLYIEVPGLRREIRNVVALGDMMVVEWRVGKGLEGSELQVWQPRDGKIVANRIYGRAT